MRPQPTPTLAPDGSTGWSPAGDPDRFAGIRRDYTPARTWHGCPAASASATRWRRWAPRGCGSC